MIMQYKRNIPEAVLQVIFLISIVSWHMYVYSFLTNEQFLNVLTTSAVTLSGLGVTLLGIILVLPEPATGIEGRISIKVEKTFLSMLKRSTTYFLLSSFLAFMCYVVSESILMAVVLCSGLSTILFLSGLLYLFYVCLNIEKLARVVRTNVKV